MKVMDGVLIVAALLLALSFYRLQRDETSVFNLMDLLMENGRLSRLACAFVATLIITSWIMVRLALDGKLTEGYFMAYGGMWVAGIVAKMFGTSATSSSTKIESTTTFTPTPPAAPVPSVQMQDVKTTQYTQTTAPNQSQPGQPQPGQPQPMLAQDEVHRPRDPSK